MSCLPVYLSSCLPQVVASGRLAFGRFTLSREGLSALLWLTNLAPSPLPPLPPPPQTALPPRETTTRPGDGRHSRIRRLRRLRISYVVSFEVDRAGVVLVGDDEDAVDAANQQHIPPLRSTDSRDGVSKAAAQAAIAAAAAAAPTTPARSSSAPSFLFRRHSSPLSTGANAPGDNSDADKSAAAPHRATNLIRITVPRVGIRACSIPLPPPPTARPRDSGRGKKVDAAGGGGGGGGERRDRPRGTRLAEGDAYGLAMTVTAESLEGHLEMDDPGASVAPISFPPFDKAEERDGPGVATPPSSTMSSTFSPDALSANRSTTGGLSAASGVAPSFFAAVDEPQSSASSVGRSARSSAQARATPLRETHRLRWLAIRKVSFRTGAAKPANAQNAAGKSPTSAQKVLGGRPGSGGSVLPLLSGKVKAPEVEGLAMEGLWAEWSPVLFFLAGKSGAMVRTTRAQEMASGTGVVTFASMSLNYLLTA